MQEGPKPGVETEGVILDYDRLISHKTFSKNPFVDYVIVLNSIAKAPEKLNTEQKHVSNQAASRVAL